MMHTRSDNKPLTLKDLLDILKQYPDLPVNKTITMSSDEEGNDMLKLYGVEISPQRNITLWPVH